MLLVKEESKDAKISGKESDDSSTENEDEDFSIFEDDFKQKVAILPTKFTAKFFKNKGVYPWFSNYFG